MTMIWRPSQNPTTLQENLLSVYILTKAVSLALAVYLVVDRLTLSIELQVDQP